MTYQHLVQLLIQIVVVSSIASRTFTDLKFDFPQIAARCCPTEMVGCCEETIRKRKPLNCSTTVEALVSMSDCLQKQMFGARSLNLAKIEDVECCQVFSEEGKDADESCFATCVQALRTPSIGSVNTLRSIKYCRPDNRDYACFRRCQSHLRSRNSSDEKFPYLAVCEIAGRIDDNVLYVGPELKN